jgi:hypothetical protein
MRVAKFPDQARLVRKPWSHMLRPKGAGQQVDERPTGPGNDDPRIYAFPTQQVHGVAHLVVDALSNAILLFARLNPSVCHWNIL